MFSPEALPLIPPFKIFNSGYCFRRLLRKLKGIKKQFPATEFLFAIEPFGYYRLPLLFFFKKRGFEFYSSQVYLSSAAVKRPKITHRVKTIPRMRILLAN